uniref:C2H2-type domain-containing protein n=1 Tax=viral metagenome TaxID=1070528 RepID=A0A6C0C5U2_9ZZZZ
MKKSGDKSGINHHCKKCDYTCRDNYDWQRHLSTTKHKMDNEDNERITQKVGYHCMVCDKIYKYASGLSKHKKKCFTPSDGGSIENTIVGKSITCVGDGGVDLEKEFLKQEVSELKNMMKHILNNQSQSATNLETLKDVIPKIGNTYNNKMSINIYLNEKCKDAMNLTDFVENVKVSLEDILYTKNHGFAKGISNIFAKQLQDMEPTQRPIHCSDKKRMQFYVKDADKWEKDKSHEKIDKTIDYITYKQIKQVKLWEKTHPNYLEDDKLLMEWQTMIQNMTGGTCDNQGLDKEKSSIKRELGMTVEVKHELMEKKI